MGHLGRFPRLSYVPVNSRSFRGILASPSPISGAACGDSYAFIGFGATVLRESDIGLLSPPPPPAPASVDRNADPGLPQGSRSPAGIAGQ